MTEHTPSYEDQSRDDLLNRIAALEAALGYNDTKQLISAFRIPPTLANLLSLLISTPYVTAEEVEKKLGACKDLKVAICRLRKELAKYEIEIKSRRFSGYWIEDATKDRIRAMLTDKVSGS